MVKVFKVKAKNIFTPTKIPECAYSVNQYVGCQYACLYCYARFLCKWKRYGEWGSWVEVKVNAPDLVRNRFVYGRVCMSTISDPYQPLEEKLMLTRRILENMHKGIRLSILTKSDLVIRDIDILKKFSNVEVGLTVNGLQGREKEVFEPYSPPHARRIRALEELYDFGIKTYCFISPVIPKLVDVNRIIDELKELVSYFMVEFINFRAAGKGFVNALKNMYPRSYEILTDKEAFIDYVGEVIENVEGVRARFIFHKPK